VFEQTESNDKNACNKENGQNGCESKWRRKSEGDNTNDALEIEGASASNKKDKKNVKKLREESEEKTEADVVDIQTEDHEEYKNSNENTTKDDGENRKSKSSAVIQGGSTYVPFHKIREENERRRKELEESKKRRKSVDIEVEDESFSDKPKRKNKRKLELKVGTHVACRAPEELDEYYWIAKVLEEPRTVKPQKIKVQWYDGSGLDERTYVETQLTDYIPVNSVFHSGFDLIRIKRLNRVLYVLREDLEPYDLSDEE